MVDGERASAGETAVQEAVGERERLKALRLVEVDALLFVDDVQPGPDEGNAVHRARGEHATVAERAEGAIDRELRQDRRVC